MANAKALTVINLNVDKVPNCAYTLGGPYNPGLTFGTDTFDALPPISTAMIINGNGSTITSGNFDSHCVYLSCNYRILEIGPTGILTISHTTISEGHSVVNCFFRDGCLGRSDGGGIYNLGVLTVLDSKVIDNWAAGVGGGIYSSSILIVSNSTIGELYGAYGNHAGSDGGGIYNAGSVPAVTYRVAFAGNTPNNCAPPGTVIGCQG